MSKSFCSGCKHWVYIQPSENNGKGFHYCDIFNRWELKWRKLWCNGKAKEIREAMTREEAIKAIKGWDFLGNNEKEAIETLIPELKEPKDERIIREITEFILTHRIDTPNDIEDTNSWLAWLEKQAPKSKWSEEDEKILMHIIQDVEVLLSDEDERFEDERRQSLVWLKSLKQRMEEQ